MSHKKKIKIQNLIGSRKILKDLKEVIKTLEHDSALADRMKTHARSRSEYVYYDTLASEKRDTAMMLDVFADRYRIL